MTLKQEQRNNLGVLRDLLLEPEQGTIRELQEQIKILEHKLYDKNANTIHFSQMIAETIQTRLEQDDDLRTVLKPLITDAVQDAIKKNPDMIASALLSLYEQEKRLKN